MTYPTAYDPAVNFASEEAASTAGRSAVRTIALDAELSAISTRIGQIISCITAITRSDAALLDGIVTIASLSTACQAYLTAAGGAIKGTWLTATSYVAKDVVVNGTGTYICASAHTSGVFATDLAAVKWVKLYDVTSFAASGVTFTPTGGISASNVQAAIEEVDSEAAKKASNLSDLASRATSFTNLVAAGGTMTGALTFSGARINEAKGADVASASTIDLDAATGNLVDVTGTTAITAITLSQGRESVVRFTGVLTLTNGANLVLPGAANITTAAGDYATFRGYAAGVVRCVDYNRADGTSLVGNTTSATHTTPTLNGAVAGTSIASQSDMETGTATDKLATPGRMQYHPGMAKAWAGNNSATLQYTYNVSSLTNNGTGDYTYNFTNSLSTSTYAVVVSGSGDRATPLTYTRAVGSFRVSWIRTNDSTAQASGASGMAVFGDFA